MSSEDLPHFQVMLFSSPERQRGFRPQLAGFTGPSALGRICVSGYLSDFPTGSCESAALLGPSLASHPNKAGLCRAIHYRPVGAPWLRTCWVHSVDAGTRAPGTEDVSEIEASGEGSGVDVRGEGGDVSHLAPVPPFSMSSLSLRAGHQDLCSGHSAWLGRSPLLHGQGFLFKGTVVAGS